VRADYIGHQFVVTVVDTGDGIDNEFLDNIFERFATGGNKGTGLGLSICYELIQQMGGNIQISSRRGRGTTVWITLPCETGEIVRK
jgi:signal transduction histidine kinase